MLKTKITSLVIGSFLLVTRANAALGGLETTRVNSGYDSTALMPMIAKFVKFGMSFLAIIFIAMMIFGGASWMINSRTGKDKEIAKAKNILTAAVIGLIIVTAAFAVTAFISDTFTL